MKFSSLAKRIFAIALVLIIAAVILPAAASNTEPDGSGTGYYAVYNPYGQFLGKATGVTSETRTPVDYAGLDFAVTGSYYSAALAPLTNTIRDSHANNLYISKVTDTDVNGHNNNCVFLCAESFSNAVGTRLATNNSGGMIKLTFTAPESATYKIVPLEIERAGGKSMLLTNPQSYDGMQPEYFSQTFTVMQGSTSLFTKTLTLDNYADVTADIDSNISVKLAKGEELSFCFESNENWGRTNLYVNFEIRLTEYSGDSVSDVYFANSNYLTSLDNSINIAPVIVPPTANNQKVTYTVDDETVLTVKADGTVVPKKAGYTRVGVKTEDGGFEAETTVAVYKSDAPVYKVKPLYDAAAGKIGSVTVTTTADNDIESAWQPLYHNGTEYVICEKVTRDPWGGSNFGIKFHSAAGNHGGAYGGLSQYISSGSFYSEIVYGRQDTEPNGAALLFTAPEYGIYTLTSENGVMELAASTVNYMNSDSNAASAQLTVNIYLNDSKLYSDTLTKNKTKADFPVLNSLEMNKGDTLRIELETNIWEKGAVNIFPQVIKVLDEKPVVPTTGITLSDNAVNLIKGGTHTLIATVLPVTASDKEVIFISSNEKVATVSESGIISAVAPGTAVITAKSGNNSEISATCTVTVTAEKLNFIKTVWPAARDEITGENELNEYTISSQFVSGSLTDGVYTDFEYALKNNWGNPRAILFTNDTNEKGSNTSKQSLSLFDGKASIGSYNTDSWVYIGYKADADGEYTFSGSDTCSSISLALASYCTVDDLIKWGEDQPFYVRITKNGETLWPQNNPAGYELKPSTVMSVGIPTLSGIRMYKGDVIRIEVLGQSKIPSRHVTVQADFDIVMNNAVAINTPVTGVKLSDSSCELSIGTSYQLSATVTPSNADNKNIRWISSDPATVKVNSTGKLTSLKQGNAVVYAVSEENGVIKAQCNVTVTSFKVIDYTPDEMMESLHRQLNGEVVVNAMPIDLDTNWSAQVQKKDSDKWETLEALTTYDWNNTGSPACYAFLYASQTSVGMEKVSGYHTPYVATTEPKMALVFTASRAGTYSVSPDLRNGSIYLPGTYVNGRIKEEDRNKEYKFSIEVNGNEIYSVNVSAVKNSFAFPTLENIFLNAGDTIKFIITDNAESSSPIDVYFSPVISLIKPDPTDHAPFADDCEYILEPDKVFTTKLKSVHPNGRPIMYEILDSNPNATLTIAENGTVTYTPNSGYKGIDVRRVRLYDSIGKESMATLTFMVANEYDAVKVLTKALLAADPDLSDDGAKGINWGDSVWKYQYTYDGLTYSNGSPKYYDTDSVESIKNAGWWGYNTYSDKMPQACVTDVNGVGAIRVMAGHSPWGKNAVGGITFIAPNSGTYLLRGNELFDKILLAADLEKDTFKNPMNVWISKNGKKIWPVEETGIKLSREVTEVDFPELKVAMQTGDTLRICISGNDYNERQNLVAVAPTVYDIGVYDARFDPNPETEGGTVITDDDGEPMVKYDKYSVGSTKLSALKGNYSEPIVKKGYTVNKVKKYEQIAPFAFEISYDSCKGAAGYTVNVYRKTEEGSELFATVDSKELKVQISDLEEGEYSVQVLAVNEYGQYIEVYTSGDFSVDASGNFKFDNPVNILTVVIITVGAVLLLGGAVLVVILIAKKRKMGAKSEKGSID